MEKDEELIIGEEDITIPSGEMYNYLVTTFTEVMGESLNFWGDLKNAKKNNPKISESKAQRTCMQHSLNLMGKKGWKLVISTENGVMYFVRSTRTPYDGKLENLGLTADENSG